MDLKPLVTLLAIVNPMATVPFFIHDTRHFAPLQRKRTLWISAFSAFAVISARALLGLILAALAVEVMAEGLHKLFPVRG